MSLLSKIDFGNEAGDDADPEELTSYFVEQTTFNEFVNPKNKILIATAKKGTGKSALVQWLSYRIPIQESDAIVVKCRGADLARGRFSLDNALNTPGDHIRDWMIRICGVVNRSLASRIKFAMKDDDITLVEAAELDGFKERNFIGCLLDRFTRVLDKGQPVKSGIKDEVAMLKRGASGRPRLWILIDDLDATFQNTKAECLDLGTFFSACRYLVQDVLDVCFRVTLRTDVWPIIRIYDEAQDKTEQYIREIVWERDDFRKLLYKRIKSQAELLGIPLPSLPAYANEEEREEAVVNMVFVPKMPWKDKDVYTYRVIYTLAYHRPRWAIQLCKLSQAHAVKHGVSVIGSGDIDGVWAAFGQKRIADLVSEHKHQCSRVDELVNAFRGCGSQLTRDELLVWVRDRIVNHMTPMIEGRPVKLPMEIAHFLYRIGFIVARSEEVGGNYEHYHFSEMPDFLTSRTNKDFNAAWEIHPCYRHALDIQKINQEARGKRGVARGRADDKIVSSLFPPITGGRAVAHAADFFEGGMTGNAIAARLGKRPAEVLAALVKVGVFVKMDQEMDREVVDKIEMVLRGDG